MGYLFVGCVPRVKTNLCSVTGKTGTGGKAVGRGARGSGLPSPAAFSSHARSSHVIPTLACALAWDLWLRHSIRKSQFHTAANGAHPM